MCCCSHKSKCRKPEKLKDQPGNCSPQQIRECHGDDRAHPCATQEQD
jgi:hypothetical protein